MIRYGILSTASITGRFIAGVRESQDGYVQAIASRTREKAQAASTALAIDCYYGNYDDLFLDEQVDVIYIPTVNGFHYRDCKKALAHHKHVLVEKPFALSLKEAKELFILAKANNCFLMEAQKAIFLPATNKIKQLIGQNAIGSIKYIELKASFPGRFDYDHWMYDLNMGGGSLYGSATYTIEYLQHIFNTDDLKIDGTCIKAPTNSDEICNFQLVINQDILVSSTIAMNVNLVNEAVFYGEKGRIIVPNFWKADHFEMLIAGKEPVTYNFPYQSEFVYEIKHVHDCLKQGAIVSEIMTPAMTLQTIDLVETLQQKWKKSR